MAFWLFNKYLLRTYYVPGIVVGAEYVIWLVISEYLSL